MNKILKSFLIIGLGLGIFTACDDDRDSNPTLISPTEFVLNTPAHQRYSNRFGQFFLYRNILFTTRLRLPRQRWILCASGIR
mgnify:CR=1 FL=1